MDLGAKLCVFWDICLGDGIAQTGERGERRGWICAERKSRYPPPGGSVHFRTASLRPRPVARWSGLLWISLREIQWLRLRAAGVGRLLELPVRHSPKDDGGSAEGCGLIADYGCRCGGIDYGSAGPR